MLHLQQKSLLENKRLHSTHHISNLVYPSTLSDFFKAIVIYTVGFLLVVCFWPCTGRKVLQIKICPICCYCHVIANISPLHTSDAIVCALFALQLTVRWKTIQPLNVFLGNQSSAKKRLWYFCYNWIYRNPQLLQVVVTALHNIPAMLIGKLGSLMIMLFFSCSRHFRLCTIRKKNFEGEEDITRLRPGRLQKANTCYCNNF